MEDHLSSAAADLQVEEAITAGIFRHLKPRITEAKKNNRRVYEDKMKSIRQLFTRPKRDLKEIHHQLLLVQNEKRDLEAQIVLKEAALEKQKRQTRQLAQRLKILDENNAIMNVMNKEKISITNKADWLLKKCLLELALLKQNFDNRDQKFISRANMNSKLQLAMSCVENLKTLVTPTPRKNKQEGSEKAVNLIRAKSKTEITSKSVTKMSNSKLGELDAPRRKFRKRELLSESNNRIKDMRPTSVAETVIIKKNVRSRIPKTVKRGRFVSLPQEQPDNRIDSKRKILNRMRLKKMSQ